MATIMTDPDLEQKVKEAREKLTNQIIKKNLPGLLKACKHSLREIRNPHTAKEVYRQMSLIMTELNNLKKLGEKK